MRLAFLLCAVAACYRPSLEDACTVACGPGGACPSGSHCAGMYCMPDDGVCHGGGGGSDGGGDDGIDAPEPVHDDAARDGSPATCLADPPHFDRVLYGGTELTFDRARMHAMQFSVGTVLTYDGTMFESSSSIYQTILEPVFSSGGLDYAEISGARLAADGLSYVLVGVSSSTTDLMIARRVQGAWQTPVKITAVSQTGMQYMSDGAWTPSSPTDTNPRRMLLQTVDGFVELEEVTPGGTQWREKFTIAHGTWSVDSMSAPSMTASGLRLVFIGNTLVMSNPQVWISERPNLDVPFPPPIPWYNAPGNASEDAPMLADDCSALYYTDRSTTQIAVARR